MLQRNSSCLEHPSMILILEAEEGLGELWLGDRKAAENEKLLKQKNIKTVLTMAYELFITYKSPINHKKYAVHNRK